MAKAVTQDSLAIRADSIVCTKLNEITAIDLPPATYYGIVSFRF